MYARFSNPELNLSAFRLLAVRMLPPVIITLPLFPVVNALKIYDTHILPVALYAAFYVSLDTWIKRAFIMQLPVELEEAAAVDGTGLWHILVRIILPLFIQGLIAVCIFVMVFAWDECFFALVFITRGVRTAPVVIGELLSTVEGVQWDLIFAAASSLGLCQANSLRDVSQCLRIFARNCCDRSERTVEKNASLLQSSTI